jgi:FdhE protein
MKQESLADKTSEAMAAALNQTKEENPHLDEVLKAFRAILIEQARWKAELSEFEWEEAGTPDPEQFSKGIPLTERERLIRLGEQWHAAVEWLIPALAAGFPKIRHELEQLQAAVLDGRFSPDGFLSAAFGGRADEAREIGGQIGLEAEVLAFALAQAAKPLVEKRAEALQPLIKGLAWNKGFCPICGSFPELSLLREKEGQRWLRCGFCSSTWRFHRTACPFCDAQEPGGLEIIFVEGREYERVEVCHQCKKYMPGIDLRNLANEVVLEVAGFALMPLEAIAQEQGFLPMFGSKWNLI